MKVQVRYFASIREALGPGELIDVPGACTLGALRDRLIERGGAHAQALARSRALRGAIDQVMHSEDALLAEGSEVAFFPPVTGG